MDELLEEIFKIVVFKETEKLMEEFRNKEIITMGKLIELDEYDDAMIISTIVDLGRYEQYKVIFKPKGVVDIDFLVHTLNELGYTDFSIIKNHDYMTFNIGL